MGETIKLSGEQALNFVRTRYGLEDSSNESRMLRQREYVTSLFDALNEKYIEDEDFLEKATFDLSEYMVSNFTVTQMENLIDSLSNYEFKDIYVIDGESKIGEKFLEFYADEDSVNNLVLDLFYTPEDR